jgi:hypothetical protein
MNRIWNVVVDMINTEYQIQRASESQMGKYPKNDTQLWNIIEDKIN